jgi:hypothetical protein
MTNASERVRAAVLSGALAASWPSVVAAALIRFALRFSFAPGQTMRSTFFVAACASAGGAAVVGWFAEPSARRKPGRWVPYGILSAFPLSSIWAVLGENAVGNNRLQDIALSSVTVWCYGAPAIVVVGMLIGCQLMVVLNRRADGAAVGLSFGLALVMVVILKL